jgi:hypothetical protein
MKLSAEEEAYLAERRSVLLNEDVEVMRAHLVKWGTRTAATADTETLRIAWHKARTVWLALPDTERQKSLAWLQERGYRGLLVPQR